MAMPLTLLCLHGWGGSQESFDELRRALKGTDIVVLAPDFPGFGEAPEPRHPWTNEDYVTWVAKYIHEHIKGPYALLGHSHGGRIAIKLSSTLPTGHLPRRQAGCPLPTHLFLCAPAGIRHPRHIKRIIGLTLAKTGKFFLSIPGFKYLQPLGKKILYKLVRVHDYEKASPVMRQTLINIAREDLRPLLSKVTIPTDIFWGRDDRMTPYIDAQIIHKGIKDSILHTFPGIRHRVHRDKAKEIAEVIHDRIDQHA